MENLIDIEIDMCTLQGQLKIIKLLMVNKPKSVKTMVARPSKQKEIIKVKVPYLTSTTSANKFMHL